MVNFKEEPNTIKFIQATCQWERKDFDGWVIGRAWYCLHSRSEPASCKSISKKAAPGYALLETTAYGADYPPCRSLEICLVDINVLRNTGNIKEARCIPGQLTMTFLPEDLKSLLSAFRDTNPIHYGPDAVAPGLWTLSRLKELYGSHGPVETLSIRFLHPVHAGGSVCLIHKSNMVTGTMGSTTCFTITIHSPDQT